MRTMTKKTTEMTKMKNKQNDLPEEQKEGLKKLAANLLDQLLDTLFEDVGKRTLVHCVMQDDNGKELMTVEYLVGPGY